MDNTLYREVKASDELPKERGKYFARFEHSSQKTSVVYDLPFGFHVDDRTLDDLIWLEPIPESNQDEEAKNIILSIMNFQDKSMEDLIKELSSKYHITKI